MLERKYEEDQFIRIDNEINKQGNKLQATIFSDYKDDTKKQLKYGKSS